MNKLVAIGATAMMGMTSLGMTQMVTHAAEKDASPAPYTSMIKNLSQAKLGSIQTKADTDVVNIPDANFKTLLNKQIAKETGTERKATDDITKAEMNALKAAPDCNNESVNDITGAEELTGITANYIGLQNNKYLHDITPIIEAIEHNDKLKEGSGHGINLVSDGITNIEGLDGNKIFDVSKQSYTASEQNVNNKTLTLKVKVDVRNTDGSIPDITPNNGGIYDKATNEITWTNLNTTSSSVSYAWNANVAGNEDKIKFTGTYTIPVKFTDKQDEQNPSAKVEYDYTSPKPSEPGWYGVVPTSITLKDKATEEEATVKLVNASDQTKAYSGEKSVDVKVASTNAYKLLDPSVQGANVSYELLNAAGTAFKADRTEQELGTMNKVTTKLDSKAKLTGDATETGNYTDTLNYHFTEK